HSKSFIAREFGMDHGDGTTQITNLVTESPHQDLGANEDLLEVEFRTVAQLLGSVEHNGRETGTRLCLVGREPDVSHKHLAVQSLSVTLHFCPKGCCVLRWGNACQRGKKLPD